MIASGMAYSYELADSGVLRLHQVAGQALIVVLAWRLLAKMRQPRSVPHPHTGWERVLAHTVHFGLYLTLIAFVVTGYVSASALREPALLWPVGKAFALSDTGEQLLDLHYMLKWVLLGLFSFHILGVLKHALIDKDTTLSNMIPPKRKEP